MEFLPDFRRKEVAVPHEQRADEFEDKSPGDAEKFRDLNDAKLLAALKNEIPGAFLEIVARYQALLFRYARNFGVDPGERHEWVSSVMHDVVLALLQPGAVVPDSLGAYFARSCRNKAYADHRAATRRRKYEEDAAECAIEPASECEMEESSSGDGGEARWNSSGLPTGLVKLAIKLEGAITPEERVLLDWSSESVPLRLIAEWLGITRAAAAQRVSRLKQRLRAITPRIASDFSEEEQTDIRRFFQRVVRPEGAAALNAKIKGAIGDRANLPEAMGGDATHGDINGR